MVRPNFCTRIVDDENRPAAISQAISHRLLKVIDFNTPVARTQMPEQLDGNDEEASQEQPVRQVPCRPVREQCTAEESEWADNALSLFEPHIGGDY